MRLSRSRYFRRRERAALVGRLEMAVEHGVLSAYGAVESYRREVPVWLQAVLNREFWTMYDRLYDMAQTRLGVQMGLTRTAATKMGPRMRAFNRREGRPMRYDEVTALLTLLSADTE